MVDIVEVPITVIKAQIEVPLLQKLPQLLREGLTDADAKVGNLDELLPENVLTTDQLLVTRQGTWNRRMPLSTLLSMAGGGGGGASGLGEVQLDPTTGAGGNTVQLVDKAAYIFSASPLPVVNLRMPAVFRDGQECLVSFSQRVQTLNLVATGTDGGIAVTVSNQGKPTRAIQPGTMILFRYNRAGSTYWADKQWHIVGVSGKEDPSWWSPTRDFGAKFDATTLDTAAIQAAWTAAKKAPPSGFLYGGGGEAQHEPGVALAGALSLSRQVTLRCVGAQTSHVIRADYSDRAGVPGTDAMITMLDDGIGQGGLVVQNNILNLSLDGRRQAIGDDGSNTNPMRAHTRHGILVDVADDGTDRVFNATDLQITNCPGDGIRVVANSQVRGGNWKVTNCRRVYFFKCKDGKIDEIGFGANGPDHNNAIGNLDDLLASIVMDNCASLKVGRADLWTGGKCHAIPLLLIRSCAKTVIDEGEIEGMVVIIGDNNNGNSKAYRQATATVFQCMNWKVSEDLYAAYVALGRTANVLTGAGYVATCMKVIDANGVKVPTGSAGYKLGQPTDVNGNRILSLPATPPVMFWFGTQIDSGDSQYADWIAACGEVDASQFALTWWEGKSNPGGRRSRSVYAATQHVANMPHKLRGLRLGTITWRDVGTQHEDEVALDGAQWDTQYDKGLFYLWTDPQFASGNWAAMRKLTDRDLTGPGADPVTGYVTFNAPNWSAEATRLSTLLGRNVMAYMVFKQ